MKRQNFVYCGKTKTGRDLSIRYPRKEDAERICKYLNEISQEKSFMRLQGEKITLDDEKKYLKELLKKMKEEKALQLLAFVENSLVAMAAIRMQDMTERHIGSFGISVIKEFRQDGIGTILTRTILDEAEKRLKDLEIVTLYLFSQNKIGYELYKKLHFQEYGRLKGGLLRDSGYDDAIYMFKRIERPSAP